MIYNFHMIQRILHKAVQIKSVVQLDKRVFGLVCEESAFEKEAIENLGARIRRNLKDLRIRECDWITCIRQIFKEYDVDDSGELDTTEFLAFLGNLDVFMTQESFRLLWECLDFDLSGSCTHGWHHSH